MYLDNLHYSATANILNRVKTKPDVFFYDFTFNASCQVPAVFVFKRKGNQELDHRSGGIWTLSKTDILAHLRKLIKT